MSAFYVGQRVRIVAVFHQVNSALIGTETVVEHIDPLTSRIRTSASVRATFGLFHLPDHLEPILYDGNKLVEWSECLWRPEHAGAQA